MSTSCYAGRCVVVFGTVSLQQYIFQSNRLRENIGASYLAKYWLGDGLVKTAQADTTAWKKYEKNPRRDPLKNPIAPDKEVNVIYIGGGNAALLCDNKDIANEVVRRWSRELLVKAPELRVAVGYGKICDSDSLAEAYRKALNQLNDCEEALPFGARLPGIPVVRTCTSTGLPASERRANDWIAQSAACKQDAVGTKTNLGKAQKDIEKEFETILEPNQARGLLKQRFAIELEDLGGYEGKSHIAVVHADGNGMGKHLRTVVENSTNNDNEFLHHLRVFSASVTRHSKRSLWATLKYLKEGLPLKLLHNPKKIFPLRPIVYGGDDLTLVCDGRLGLDLAAYYLREFEGNIKVCDKDECVNACAGVAIVPTKFPFARAYGFADELCGLAKAHRRKENRVRTADTGSWLDFQIIQEGVTRSITALRDAQYHNLEGAALHKRPYQVPKEKDNLEEFRWNKFIAILEEFQLGWPRNRAKELVQVLTQGSAATKNFIDGAQWRQVNMPSSSVSRTGWTEETEPKKSTTPYFDPLEALDFYIALDKGDKE